MMRQVPPCPCACSALLIGSDPDHHLFLAGTSAGQLACIEGTSDAKSQQYKVTSRHSALSEDHTV